MAKSASGGDPLLASSMQSKGPPGCGCSVQRAGLGWVPSPLQPGTQVVALAGFLRWFLEKLSGSWEVGFVHLLIVCLLSGDGKAYVILLSCHADAGSGQAAAIRGIY